MTEGITSGLAVVGIVWLAKIVWQFALSPTIQNLTYHSTRIEGTWTTELGDQAQLKYREEVALQRRGNSVKGSIKCIECGPTDADLGKRYEFWGNFRNESLYCTYTIEDKTKVDFGCFCLRLAEGGNSFDGYCISYHHPTGTIKPLKYVWRRKS